jgi:5-methylcytosine-specific restriction endonuclease McrA
MPVLQWKWSFLQIQRPKRRAASLLHKKAWKEAYESNPTKFLHRDAEWRKANPHYRAVVESNRRARKAGVIGVLEVHEWSAVLEQYGNECLGCGTTESISIDHVIPISKGGPNTIDNIQPLCRSCNTRKFTWIIDFRDM